MSKAVFAVLPFLFFLPFARGQAPVPQSPTRDPENLITFTTWDAGIRKVNGHWELWVGAGNPVMIVFLAGSDKRPRAQPAGPTAPAQWFQPPQLHVNSTLAEPVTGNPMAHFDWRQAAVRCEKLDWQVVADGQVLAHFG